MKLVLRVEGLPADDWLEGYLRTTVVFATWWHDEAQIETIHIHLDRADDDAGGAYVRCALRADMPVRGPVCSGATGADVCEAVQGACNLLEVALSRPLPTAGSTVASQLAA